MIRSKIKCLPLQFPFNCEHDYWSDCAKPEDEFNPVFNRDGYYLDRCDNSTWLEIDGRAFKYGNRESFELNLAVNKGNNWLDNDIYKSLQVLGRHKLLSKQQQKLLYNESLRYSLEQVRKNASIDSYKFYKEKSND